MIRQVVAMGQREKLCRPKLISGNSNFQSNITLRGGRPELKKGNRGNMQCSSKNYVKCGCAHSGECRQDTNAYFGFGKSWHMVKDCP